MIKIKSTNQKTRKLKGRNCYEDEVEVFDLQRMMEGFLLEQNCRGNSKAIIKYYEGNILRFISYLEEKNSYGHIKYYKRANSEIPFIS